MAEQLSTLAEVAWRCCRAAAAAAVAVDDVVRVRLALRHDAVGHKVKSGDASHTLSLKRR